MQSGVSVKSKERRPDRTHVPMYVLAPGLSLGGGMLAGVPLGLCIASWLLSTALLIYFRGAPPAQEWIRVWRDAHGDPPPDKHD